MTIYIHMGERRLEIDAGKVSLEKWEEDKGWVHCKEPIDAIKVLQQAKQQIEAGIKLGCLFS
jgi:hypothetical protein